MMISRITGCITNSADEMPPTHARTPERLFLLPSPMETVSETMKSKSVPDELTQQFVDTLNNCEFARFAPGSAEQKMDDLYQRGIDVISKAEKVL